MVAHSNIRANGSLNIDYIPSGCQEPSSTLNPEGPSREGNYMQNAKEKEILSENIKS